jgi:hypothetical protein
LADKLKLLGDFPRLRAYLEKMYARPSAPQRIADAFKAIHAAQCGRLPKDWSSAATSIRSSHPTVQGTLPGDPHLHLACGADVSAMALKSGRRHQPHSRQEHPDDRRAICPIVPGVEADWKCWTLKT